MYVILEALNYFGITTIIIKKLIKNKNTFKHCIKLI